MLRKDQNFSNVEKNSDASCFFKIPPELQCVVWEGFMCAEFFVVNYSFVLVFSFSNIQVKMFCFVVLW